MGFPVQGLITRFKLSKYKSKVTVKVTRSKVWYQSKGLVIRNTHVKYESPMWCISKVMAQVKVFCGQVKSRSNLEVKVTRSKILVPMERSCHKEYTCEI